MRTLATSLLVLFSSACAPRSGWFSRGPKPPALTGVWIDSARTSPTDSSIWILTPGGEDRLLRIRVVSGEYPTRIERKESRYASWYLSGDLDDPAHRALCTLRRSRDGGSCTAFRLDTLMTNGVSRRRLVLLGYRGQRQTGERVLLERIP